MEIRLTVKRTPGRPILAVVILGALLAGTVGLAWWVSVLKASRPTALAPAAELPRLPLRFRPPLDWQPLNAQVTLNVPRGPGLSPAAFWADLETRGLRNLAVYRLEHGPASPARVLADALMLPSQRQDEPLDPVSLGPLPAWQRVTFEQASNYERLKVINRLAAVGPGRYVLFRLTCLGPPMPREFALLAQLADSVRLDPRGYLDAAQLGSRYAMSLGEQRERWQPLAASPFARQVHLLPRRGEDDAPPLRGQCRLTIVPADSSVGLNRLLADYAAAGLASAAPSEPACCWPPPTVGPPMLDRNETPKVEQRLLGTRTAWRTRVADDELVRLTWLFHPSDEQGLAMNDRAAWLTAWAVPDDEPALIRSAEALVTALRLGDDRGADAFDTAVDLTVAERSATEWLASGSARLTGNVELGYEGRSAGRAVARARLEGRLGRLSDGRAGLLTVWTQGSAQSGDDARTAPARWAQVRWTLPAGGEAFGLVGEWKMLGRVTAKLEARGQGDKIAVELSRGPGEPAFAQLDRPGNFLALPLLVSAAEALGPGRSMRFRAIGPSPDRLAGLRIQRVAEPGGVSEALLLWLDYDPEPTRIVPIRYPPAGSLMQFARDAVIWSPELH